MSFGKWLVQARERAGLTQRELAQRAGISTTYVSGLEREEPSARDGSPRRPRVEKIDALARALGIQRDEARLAAGYAPAKPFTKPATIEELADALNALGLPVPQAPFPLDPDGDWCILACGVEPKPNQIVVCKLHSGYTIKRFKLNDARGKRGLFLVPANDDYSPRELLPADEAEIVGTVTSIIKRL